MSHNLLISGATGRMGRQVFQEASSHGFTVVAGLGRKADSGLPFPVYRRFADIREKPEVVIDFSSPHLLGQLLDYLVNNHLPGVLCTSGYSKEQMDEIARAAKGIPIIQSANMSRGIYTLRKLAAQAAAMLPDFDIEIIEKHHSLKADSPSGTAMQLLSAVRKENSRVIHGREGELQPRPHEEIGIHAIRGGTVTGEHEVGFYGNNEVITISHQAQSRGVFAAGALQAAEWLLGKGPGLYGMKEFIEG